MKIVVTGTRGIPDIPGGVETHCQHLYPLLVGMGCEVTVLRRSCYVADDAGRTDYEGVSLLDLYAPRRKSVEAIVHTALAVVKAWRLHADVVHIHAVGPALMVPLARLLGLKVVVTNHGPDYERDKWSAIARRMLRLGEWCQARFANQIIAISQPIVDTMAARYGRTKGVSLIYNGVDRPEPCLAHDYLDSLGLSPGKYVLAVARFVPEKRLHLLLEAFTRCEAQGCRLVFAGDADHDDDYSRNLKRQAHEAGAVLTGYVTGEPLRQLWTGARLFVLPSSHEGLPISLLEAMAWQRDVLASDIAANRLPELAADDFFATDSLDALTAALSRKLAQPQQLRHYDLEAYNWSTIAHQTLEVYNNATKNIGR